MTTCMLAWARPTPSDLDFSSSRFLSHPVGSPTHYVGSPDVSVGSACAGSSTACLARSQDASARTNGLACRACVQGLLHGLHLPIADPGTALADR